MGIGRSKPKKVSTKDRAILDLKVQRDKLRQYRNRLSDVVAGEEAVARQLLQEKKKDRALLALRRKKYQEQLLIKTEGMIENVENLVSSIEFASVEKQVLDNLREGNALLSQISKEMGGLEGVERLLDETAEAQQEQNEISDMLSGKLTKEDNEDVELQLQAIEDEVLKENLPSAPQSKIAVDASRLQEAVGPSSSSNVPARSSKPALVPAS
mmetsp:Transcript_32519/g.52683  ORF Transcript_32519/g.52683 Transcript_32519/m.52683 type:complete len:212 (+) Transcript_32519:123-758(+)